MPEKLRKTPYYAHLMSQRWRDTREIKLEQTDGRCEKCGKRKQHMNVHHLTYENVYNERLEDLQVLCRRCHKDEHGIDRKEKVENKLPISTKESRKATCEVRRQTLSAARLAYAKRHVANLMAGIVILEPPPTGGYWVDTK